MNKIKLHSKQTEALDALCEGYQIIVVCSGIQGGKTTAGATLMWFLLNQHVSSEDTFLIAAPTYKILNQATIPKFKTICGSLGSFNKVDAEFVTKQGSHLFLRTATDPDCVEGITNCRGIWLDEGGLVSRYFFENLMGRAAFKRAPIIITTTPYSNNWLSKIVDEYKKGNRKDIKIIQFRSIDNPYFPKEEYERQKTLLDSRRFRMKYEGEFGLMEGLVYEKVNKRYSSETSLDSSTKYYAGVDWGYNDPFSIIVRAVTVEGIHYDVDEFYKSGLTISDMIDAAKAKKNMYNIQLFVCDPSRPENIEEFNRNGLPAVGANNEIRFGIDKHIELIKTNRYFVLEDMCPNLVDEYNVYHYAEPKELKIDDSSKDMLPVDASNHGLDGTRYLTVELSKIASEHKKVPILPDDRSRRPREQEARLRWLKRGGNRRFENVL